MRSWTGPVVIGIALGIGFALASNSEQPGQPASRTEPPTTNHGSAAATDGPATASVRDRVARGPDSGVTLTFDDGPHGTHTPQILDILDRHDAAAVFCVVGRKVEERPGLVGRIVAEGHVLCNHTFTHDSLLSQRPVSRIEQEVSRTRKAIDAAAPGAAVPFFRQPTMFVSEEVGAVTDTLGYRRLDWTIDTKDWAERGSDAIVERVTERLRPGSVILLHDGGGDRTATVEALPRILDAIADAGLGVGLPST